MECSRSAGRHGRQRGEGAESVKDGKIGVLLRSPGVLAAALCLCLLAGFFLGSLLTRSRSTALTVEAGAPPEAIPPRTIGLVDINSADAALLQTLPGIGPELANRILAYREANGGFHYLYELTEVKGIGESTYEGLRELITLGPGDS